jgi:hypothetical protein
VIVRGAFGEANKKLDPLVHRLAKLTAKTLLGQMLMLAPKTSRSGKDVEKVIRMRFRLLPGTGSAICNSLATAELKVMM